MKTNSFSAFIGPVVTLLPAIFVASSGGFGNVSFCLLTTLALLLCYSFATNGLVISTVLLLTGFYFLDLQFVWAFGVFISIFSGLIVTCYAWNPAKTVKEDENPSDSLKAILVETKKQLQEALLEKNALRQQMLSVPTKKLPDISNLKKDLEEKTQLLSQLKEELFSVKSKLETLKKDQGLSLEGIQSKLQEKEKVLELYKKQETELLSLLKKESQIPTE